MTSRSVFKVFGSFGPGGTFVTLAEKIIRRFWNQAYDFGDDNDFKSAEDSQIQKLRQEFVNELFNMKSDFERKSISLNPLIKVKAYAELHKIIEKYRKKLIGLEKQKLIKEKIFFINEENDQKAQQTQDKIDRVVEDVTDNLNKMAIHILQPDLMQLKEAQTQGGADEESIQERVTEAKAEEMLEAWKRLKVKQSISHGTNAGLLEDDNKLKQELFVMFGEDIDDIQKAWKFYQLDATISEEDNKKYSIQ